MTDTVIEKFPLGGNTVAAELLGYQDANLRLLEQGLTASLLVRGDEVQISGSEDQVRQAKKVLTHLRSLAAAGVQIGHLAVNYALAVGGEDDQLLASHLTESIFVTPKGKHIKPKTLGQWQYLQAMNGHDLVIGIGPAGTGKTYLAVVTAVKALKSRQVSKIVLARPAVEAGEKLGFLPGDLQDKLDPYLRPIYDALDDTMGAEQVQKYVERRTVEIVPLAYMRGRTLEDAFIILDEAQNTTPQQMKMFLTRMGTGSKAVINGDITQIDLPLGQTSGLIEAERRLRDIEEIAFCYLTRADVVRHPLVQQIIEAYERKWI